MNPTECGWRRAARSLGFVVSVTLAALGALGGCSESGPKTPSNAASSGGSAGTNATAGNAGTALDAGGGGAAGGVAGAAGSAAGGAAAGSAGATAGSGGAPALDCSKPSATGSLTTRLPCLLSATGLYAPDMATLASGVHPYAPSFELWSDGAAKQRWILLPAGSKIDTSDMDYWSFPVGTKLWKEFTRDGVRVETRLIEKQASGSWYTVAYQWRADQKEADAVPNGVTNASGTDHDIPNNDQCLTCHSQTPDKVLGFSAIQLSHDKQLQPANALEWTLGTLMADGLLSAPPAAVLSVPGTELDRKFFGYLHANCGHCHNPKGTANSQTGLDLLLKVADLKGSVNQFSVYQGILGTDIAWLDGDHPAATKRVAPGSLEDSAVYQRFIKKAEAWSMPPLGTELVDPDGKKLMEDWIGAAK
jgi:hypothetical protein